MNKLKWEFDKTKIDLQKLHQDFAVLSEKYSKLHRKNPVADGLVIEEGMQQQVSELVKTTLAKYPDDNHLAVS
jgi:hypothetical protein